LAGEYTATAANACGGKYTVTFTRTGNLDANNSLPDPATLPPRVVSPAEALRGRYHEKRTFKNGSPQQESDFSVSTDCLRTGDRCMSFFHAPIGTVQALVFGSGSWDWTPRWRASAPAAARRCVSQRRGSTDCLNRYRIRSHYSPGTVTNNSRSRAR
jgi:hypothetical protein